MGMHSVDTLVCQSWGNIGELWKLQGKMSLLKGSIKRLDLQRTYRYWAEPFGSIPI